MSGLVRAELISKGELFTSGRFSEFQYKYHHTGQETIFSIGKLSTPFILLLEDQDLEVEWTIRRSYFHGAGDTFSCLWTGISLHKTNKHIFGNFEIKASYNRNHLVNFDTSLTQKIEEDLKTQALVKAGCCMTITMKIFHEDRFFYSTRPYDNLWKNKSFSDFTFVVKGEKVQAHKCILSAHSEVFASMFDSNMLETKTDTAEIVDVEPEIFKLMMRFIYSGKLDEIDNDDLLTLCFAADKYLIKNLVSLCGYRISSNITTSNVIDTYMTADFVKAKFLKQMCVDFITKNKDEIVETEGYKNVVESGQADFLSDIVGRAKIA